MIAPEVEEFLRRNTRTFLLTIRPDGSPTGHPMIGLYRRGALYFSTYGKSAKVRNLSAHPRVCCVVTTPDDETDFRAAVVHGVADVLPPGSSIPAEEGTTLPAEVPSDVSGRSQERLRQGKRVVVRVQPEDATFLDGA